MSEERPPSYPLRMPPEMRIKLEAYAQKNSRSLQREIIARLDESLQQSARKPSDQLQLFDTDDLFKALVVIAGKLDIPAQELKAKTKRILFADADEETLIAGHRQSKKLDLAKRLEELKEKQANSIRQQSEGENSNTQD